MDYLAVGKLNPKQVATIVNGVARACKECNCALIGGETAEMSGFYQNGEYDLAGFAVGIVDKADLITSDRVREGDVLLGLPSSGLHSNGFSLVRKIIFERRQMNGNEFIYDLNKKIGEELLTPTRLYVKSCLPLIKKFELHGMVHVTGGGFYDNIPRALPDDLSVEIDADGWTMPTIFKMLQRWGNVDWHEMFRTFNCGIGMILIVAPKDAARIMEDSNERGEDVIQLGRVVRAEDVEYRVNISGGVFND